MFGVLGLAPERAVPDPGDGQQRQQAGQHSAGHQGVGQRRSQLHAGLQQPQLPEETRERRDAGQVHGGDEEQHRQQRRQFREPGEAVHRGAPAAAFNQPGHQEQAGLDGDVVRHVEDGGAQPCHRGHREPEHHIADVADQGEGQESFDVALGQGAQDPHDHGQQRGDHQRGIEGVARKQQCFRTDDRVNAHLGEQAGEHRRDRGGRRRVGVREPEGQRENGRLDPERHQEHHVQQVLRALVQVRELDGEVGHVDGAGGAVDHRDRDQEEHRGHHRDHEVGHAARIRGPVPPRVIRT